MKEHQIDVLEVKLLKRLVNGGLGLLIAHLLAPDFRGDEKVAPLEVELLVCALYLSTNKCFVFIVLCGVQVSVPEPYSIINRLLRSDLIASVADLQQALPRAIIELQLLPPNSLWLEINLLCGCSTLHYLYIF